ncbi:MAG: hypothetical protein CMG26_06685 [Candidatus Marinimicrobia bacterium]|nr:hypothetical protein [Candidatus Neomarinimicrobiota bacterium]
MIKYLEKYGTPDAIFFSYKKDEFFSIWGFDDIYSVSKNQLIEKNIMNNFQDKITEWKKESEEIAAVGFLSYDSKNIFFPNVNFKNIDSDVPLIWFGKPRVIKKIHKSDLINLKTKKSVLNKIIDVPNIKYYNQIIAKIKNYLKSGEVYQINYTQPISLELIGKEFDLYLSLLKTANPSYSAYLNLNSKTYLSMSPENFFTKINNKISSYPIKGTRMRSNIDSEDVDLKIELMNSEKDKAEHLMIVDLIRNDLGKICQYGSIKVNDLFHIKSFNTVHHMVSDINGTLKDNISETNIFEALFPGGSITGAPKQRAIEIIDQIENYSRGIYTGAMGIISNNGDMIFNIAIRTLTLENQKAEYPVGGGVVWDSTAKGEREEAIQKSKILEK